MTQQPEQSVVDRLWTATLRERERAMGLREQRVNVWVVQAVEAIRRLCDDNADSSLTPDAPASLAEITGDHDASAVYAVLNELQHELDEPTRWKAVWIGIVRWINARHRTFRLDESPDMVGYTYAGACRLIARELRQSWPKWSAAADVAGELEVISERLIAAFMQLGPAPDPMSKSDWFANSVEMRTLREITAAQHEQRQSRRSALDDPIANAKLAEIAGLDGTAMSRQIRTALGKAGKAFKKVGPGEYRAWSHAELRDAFLNLPNGKLKNLLSQHGFQTGANLSGSH